MNMLTNARQNKSIICPCPIPKRIVTSSKWLRRNDSSDVNALLHPDDHLIVKHGKQLIGNVKEKPLLSKNLCYCKKKPIMTNLSRSNSTVSLRDKSTCTSIPIIISDNDNVNKTLLAKNLDSRTSLLKFSEQRKNYEKYRQNEEKKFEEEVAEQCRKNELIFEPSTVTSITNHGSSFTNNNNENLSLPVTDKPENYLDEYVTQSISQFRDDHYFETHNIDDYEKYLNNNYHTCIHEYQLDEDLSTNPLNEDIYGRSCCKTCYKSMGNYLGSVSESSKEKSKSKINIILTSKDSEKLKTILKPSINQQFQNSLALRHQKMLY